LERRRAAFREYCRILDERDLSGAKKLGDWYLCPCCQFPTLNGRGEFEICLLCWWEDDGQDDADADLVCGGPNQEYSLNHARMNFADHLHMYESGDTIEVVAHPGAERRAMLKYVDSVLSGETEMNLGAFRRFYDDAKRNNA